jgi:hypothetical protein
MGVTAARPLPSRKGSVGNRSQQARLNNIPEKICGISLLVRIHCSTLRHPIAIKKQRNTATKHSATMQSNSFKDLMESKDLQGNTTNQRRSVLNTIPSLSKSAK